MAQAAHKFHGAGDGALSYTSTLDALGEDSYTIHRLQHATPEHLFLTTRRCFIGPVPEGWLKSHRRDWYKQHLHIHYSSRTASFSAAPNTSKQRRVTGIDGLNVNKRHSQSFPQPLSITNEQRERDEPDLSEEGEGRRSTKDPPNIRKDTGSLRVDDNGAQQREQSHETSISAAGSLTEAMSYQGSEQASKSQTQETAHRPLLDNKKRLQSDKAISLWKMQSRPGAPRKASGTSSFVTVREELETLSSATVSGDEAAEGKISSDSHRHDESSTSANRSSVVGSESSTAHLLKQGTTRIGQATTDARTKRVGLLGRLGSENQSNGSSPSKSNDRLRSDVNERPERNNPRTVSGLVRFNLPDKAREDQADGLLKVRLAQFRRRDTLKKLRRGKLSDGEILKVEKMLVRVEFTSHQMQDEFDENDSQKIESRTLEKWREFMVVCRESFSDEEDFTLQMYKSRVIRAIEKSSQKQRSAHRILLNKKTRINIFSSLDKTVVLWEPYKRGHRIFIMKPRSGASSMEWYTFLRNLLGWERPNKLQVNVPDLDVSLIIDHPFENLESFQDLEQAAKGDKEALAKTLKEEEAIAGKIVLRCMKMLEDSSEWHSVMDAWQTPPNLDIEDATTLEAGTKSQRATANWRSNPLAGNRQNNNKHNPPFHSPVGLAWKRYDRLEWVHGPNERNMYGTIGMEKSHDLELRPKQHYPTSVVTGRGNSSMLEPAPVEGFLIRRTSQKGMEKRLGRLFYKRLYYSTHNQYLVFNGPAHADPPPPPAWKMRTGSRVPTMDEISDQMPLIFSVNPYPVRNNEIEWLGGDNAKAVEDIINFDRDAYEENERRVNLLLKCEGVVDLCSVARIRKASVKLSTANESMNEDLHPDSEQDMEDEVENENNLAAADEGVFDLVLKNGLVVKLQAYDTVTRREWIQRLRALVSYWKIRSGADVELYKTVRRRNLEYLKIDEDMEAAIGQFARKWEVRQSYASSELYHMCGISCCRSIQMSGHLYRKPRLRATFERCQVILSHGRLLLFEALMRQKNGRAIPNTHHERTTSLNLSDCYIYSGLITSQDLLDYAAGNATDRVYLGSHHGTPRMYLEDGWSSTDEDAMTCFVVWRGQRKSWFMAAATQDSETNSGGKFKLVDALGKEGRAVVFKTRSRAERDHWVMSIGMEIERTAKKEDIRIVN